MQNDDKRMIRIMDKLRFIICLIVCGFVAASCNDDDGYSLDNFTVNIATVVDSDDLFYLKLDNGQKLWVAAPVMSKPKAERAIINYTLLSDNISNYDHAIRLNRISTVLTKDIIYIDPANVEEQDSIGNDPIKIISIWEGGDYLNIKFGFNFGEKYQHLVNMVADDADFDISNNPVRLEFRHNKYDDPELYGVQDYICFNLKQYKKAALEAGINELKFEIRALDFKNEEKTYSIIYKIIE